MVQTRHERRFYETRRRIADAGPAQHVSLIHCSHPGCQEEDYVTHTGRSSMPNKVVQQKFERAGWYVGNVEQRDLCPHHAAKPMRIADRKPEEPIKSLQDLAVILEPDTPKEPEPMPIQVPTAVLSDREMSREERRIIFEKLNEVYEGEDTGYAAGWGDNRVAEEVGVPRKWVEDIRAEFFGDVKDSEDIRKLLEEAGRLADQWAPLSTEYKTLKKRMEAVEESQKKIVNDLNRLLRNADDIKKAAGIK